MLMMGTEDPELEWGGGGLGFRLAELEMRK